LTASLSGAYLDATYAKFPNAPFFTPRTAAPWGSIAAPGNADGLDVINSPRFTGTFAMDYGIPLPVGEMRFNGSVYYNGGYYFDPQNRLRQAAFTLLGGSAKWVSPSTHWDVSLWGNNLLNKEVLAAASPTGGGDSLTPRAPRTFGIRLGAHF
jgi:iron complex outermembrane receptor protein